MNGQINVMGSIEHYVRWTPPPGRFYMGVKIAYYTGTYKRHTLWLFWYCNRENVSWNSPTIAAASWSWYL